MKIDYVKLGRTISHALRHEPEVYGLVIDSAGWLSLADLVNALADHGWADVSEHSISDMVNNAKKKRHEIADGKIRAYYGHTIDEHIVRLSETPPTALYHGTLAENLHKIKVDGLLPMQRNYVHLAETEMDAKAVSDRRRGDSVLLSIRAKDAFENGLEFYKEQNGIWLVRAVPAEFIEW